LSVDFHVEIDLFVFWALFQHAHEMDEFMAVCFCWFPGPDAL